MTSRDDDGTRDVSHCERLILLIEIGYHMYENGKLANNLEEIKWDEIQRLKNLCDVLPGKYQVMLKQLEVFRENL